MTLGCSGACCRGLRRVLPARPAAGGRHLLGSGWQPYAISLVPAPGTQRVAVQKALALPLTPAGDGSVYEFG